MKYSNIRVLMGDSFRALDYGQSGDVQEFETVNGPQGAKAFARRCLTPEYAALVEMSSPFNVSRVLVDEEGRTVILCEHHRKGYAEPIVAPEPDDEIPAGNIADDDDTRSLGDEDPRNHS